MFKRFFEPGALLSHQGFRNLWIGGFLMVTASGMFPIAIAVAIIDAGGGATTLGLILASRLVSGVGLTLAGGVWADRMKRKHMMFFADILRACFMVLLVFFSVASISRWWMALIVFIIGIGDAFGAPASNAITPSVIPHELLQQGNVVRGVTNRMGSILGPALGGISVALIGARNTFAVVAAFMFICALLVIRIDEKPHEIPEQRETFIRELKEGIQTVWEMPWVAAMILMATAQLMVVIAAESVLLPIITKREFLTNSVMAGASAAFAIGGAISAIVSMRLKVRHQGQFSLMVWSLLVTVPLVLAFPINPWFIYVGYLIGGLSVGPWDAFWPLAIQREIPREKQGRVFAVDQAGSAGLMPLGMALVGPVTHYFGERNFLIFAAIFHILVNIITLRVPGVRDMRTPGNSSIGEQESA